MNEEQKNIETCLAESVLAEVASVPTDPQFRSLVDEALDPLKQQAADHTGDEAYEKIVWTHRPYTFTSQVRQMKSNLILLLRRLWRFPFGRGTSLSAAAPLRSMSDAGSLRSLADMWQHYITRLSGNATYGIPSRLSQLTDLPSAPALLSDRKISNGGAEDGIADGISLAHILGHRSMVTTIDDDNSGWVCDSVMPNFPNLGDATLRMGSIMAANALNNLGASGVVRLEGLTTITSGASQYNDPMPLNATEIYADDVETSDAIFSQKSYPNLQKVSMKKVRSLNGRSFYDLQAEGPFKTLIVPELRAYDTWSFLLDYSGAKDKYLSLIHLEIGSDVSCNIGNWSPTNALDASRTDLIEEGSTAQNNLQQFLSNFLDYIAERLTDQGSGLTLTLSQAVFSSIWDANGNPQVLGDGLDQLRADIHRIIRTEKHWNVNKA